MEDQNRMLIMHDEPAESYHSDNDTDTSKLFFTDTLSKTPLFSTQIIFSVINLLQTYKKLINKQLTFSRPLLIIFKLLEIFMKKIALSLGLGLTLASGVFAANNTLEQLNSQVVSILAPFQNQSTVAKLNFEAIETDEQRALQVAGNALYSKVGSQNTFTVKVDNLSYNYGDGSAPMTIFKGALGIDFTKLLPQDQINQMIPYAAEMIEELAKEYSEEEYGDAVSVRSVITSTTKDVEGNFTSLTALISVKIDLSKLPEETSSEDIIATDAVFSLTINLKTGVMIDAYVVSNPEYIGFKEGQEGLKETLDKLLARDEEAMAEIEDFASRLDELASELVEMSNEINRFKSNFTKSLSALIS